MGFRQTSVRFECSDATLLGTDTKPLLFVKESSFEHRPMGSRGSNTHRLRYLPNLGGVPSFIIYTQENMQQNRAAKAEDVVQYAD